MNACKVVIASLQVPYYLGELMEKISEGDRLQILKASQAMLKVKTLVNYKHFCQVMYVFTYQRKHQTNIFLSRLPLWLHTQEFIAFCEAMELVPEDELETSIPTGPNAFADRRAKKVMLLFVHWCVWQLADS